MADNLKTMMNNIKNLFNLSEKSKKDNITVFIEANVVGLMLVLLTYIIYIIINLFYKIENFSIKQYMILYISGLLFHVIFEYMGWNLLYSLNYCKLV